MPQCEQCEKARQSQLGALPGKSSLTPTHQGGHHALVLIIQCETLCQRPKVQSHMDVEHHTVKDMGSGSTEESP